MLRVALLRLRIIEILVLINGISIGLRVSRIITPLADDIVGYIHTTALVIKAYEQRNVPSILFLGCSLVGSLFPESVLFLRIVSLVSIPQTVADSPTTGGQVVRLWYRSMSLTVSVGIVILLFSWIIVLIFSLLFDFKSTKTWIFSKRSDANNYFDVSKYFGTSISSLLSFIQIITMDLYMSLIIRPIINVYPQLFIFFATVQVIGAFGLVNVAAGLVVRAQMEITAERTAATQTNHGREALIVQLKLQSLVNRLKRLSSMLERLRDVDSRIPLFNQVLK